MKYLKYLIFVALVLFKLVAPVRASELEAGASAQLNREKVEAQAATLQSEKKKKEVIRRVLSERNSPLAQHADDFIEACTKYKLDCYLLPAITGLESSFGHFIPAGSYNPFGWGGGAIRFTGWDDAILTVAQGLRENYINRGAVTVWDIGPMYAASPTWAVRVSSFMSQFEEEEKNTLLYSSLGEIQL